MVTDENISSNINFFCNVAQDVSLRIWILWILSIHSFWKKLAKWGAPLKYFVKLKTLEWYENFTTGFEPYSNYYNENFNPKLRESLNLNLLKERDALFT